MKIDPHIHSVYSGDSDSKPKDILKQAKKVGLDAIAISDHNTIKGSKIAIEESKNMDILVVPSIEISSYSGHILGIGVTEEIPKGRSAIETVERIREAGGLAIIPHPYSYYRHGLFIKIDDNLSNDGVETLNARYIIGYSNNHAKVLAEKNNLAKFGSSDSHFIKSIGDCYTEIDSECNVDDILDAIIKKKTTPMGKKTSNFKIFGNVIRRKIKKSGNEFEESS
ncbi:MAG: PHP domain-containing protein [Methanobacteriaceae archaeon]|nr:PHP domain-containing protein [Methanobacteriaceae archaeon]